MLRMHRRVNKGLRLLAALLTFILFSEKNIIYLLHHLSLEKMLLKDVWLLAADIFVLVASCLCGILINSSIFSLFLGKIPSDNPLAT